jgi:hypothetical protein
LKIPKVVAEEPLADRPDAFLKEYAEQFDCTATAVFYTFEKLDITRKKIVYLLRKIRCAAGGIYGKDKAGFPR